MFERIDREADGEVYVNEVLDFLHSMAGDLDQVCSVGFLNNSENAYIISFQNEDVSELFREYRSKGDRVLYLPEFMVFGEQGGLSVKQYAAMAPCLQEMMDAVKGAGWTRFQSVEGQPIPEKDMRSVFKLVDLDKDGTISGMVHTLNCFVGGCLIFLFRN